MPWEVFKPPTPGTSRRLIPPTASITKFGIILNRVATENAGISSETKRGVILFHDTDEKGNFRIGFWFMHMDTKPDGVPNCYSITYYPKSGVARISAKSFIEMYGLLAMAKKIGRISFLIMRHFEPPPGVPDNDFYAAVIKPD